MNKLQRIAPAVPSRQLSTGRPAESSRPGRAATTFDHQKTTHRGLGARLYRAGAARCDAPFPADLTLLGLQGCVTRHDLLNWPGLRSRRSLSFSGIGRRANAILASIQHGRQGTFQRLAKGPHSHLKNLRFRDPKPTAARRPKSWFSLPTRIAT